MGVTATRGNTTHIETPHHDGMAGLSQLNGGTFFNGTEDTSTLRTNEETKCEIFELTGFSNRLEKILLALLRDQGLIKDRIEKDKTELLSAVEKVNDDLLAEKGDRTNCVNSLRSDMDKQKAEFDNALDQATKDIGKQIKNLEDKQTSDN